MTQLEKLMQFIQKPQIIVIYLILLGFIYYFIDQPTAVYFHHLSFDKPIWKVFDLLGKNQLYVAFFLFLILIFRYMRKNALYEARCWYLMFCILVLTLLNFLMKIGFGRARPELFFSNGDFGFYWFKFKSLYWSFPSGHTTTVITLAAALGFLFSSFFYSFLSIALLVIASRVVFCKHYLSDVMFSFYFTLLIVNFLTEFVKKQEWLRKDNLLYLKSRR